MRILVTGASSPLAARVVNDLLRITDAEIWCARHTREVSISDARVRIVQLDLESDEGLATINNVHFDLVVHFAGVTHSDNENLYWKVNLEGTMRLAKLVRDNGCRRFVFISTRCATTGSGAYGESKLAAEKQLQQLDWTSLLVIRPAEVYGVDGTEGLDRMLRLARSWHVVPAFWGNSGIRFAPIHVDDFSAFAVAAINNHEKGFDILEASGPEDLSGISLAGRIMRRHVAVPVPIWWPGFELAVNALRHLGMKLATPDQLKRLVSKKTAASGGDADMVRFLK